MAVERLQREAAGVDLAAFGHELGELVVEVLRAGKGLVAELRKTALNAQGHARAIEQNRRLEAFALEPQRLQDIDETDGAFEGDGVECDQRLLARLGFDVFEHLLFVIDQIVALLVGRHGHSGHGPLLARFGRLTFGRAPVRVGHDWQN